MEYFDLRVGKKEKGFTNTKPPKNPMGFLKVGICSHNEDKKEEVITLVDWFDGDEEDLCLHNGEKLDESEEKIAVELFKNQDIKFLDYVEMFVD